MTASQFTTMLRVILLYNMYVLLSWSFDLWSDIRFHDDYLFYCMYTVHYITPLGRAAAMLPLTANSKGRDPHIEPGAMVLDCNFLR